MIVFRNSGSLDLRAIKTFGLSSKDGQDKIGRFGTGLKYATAVIARHGGSMTISTADGTHVIGSSADSFRGREVTQVTLDGDPLPYTTDLGRDWEPWMAFRELYANALDEGGQVSRSDSVQEACGDETVISVELNAFEAIFFSMEEHFIGRDEAPVWASDKIEVYAGRSLFVFYRGVAVMKLKEPAAFRYNLLGYLDLTEDRTAKYDFQVRGHISAALAATDSDEIARAASDQRNDFEASLDYSRAAPSDVFLGASVSMGANCNPTAMALVKAQIPASADEATVISAGEPGADALMDALKAARRAGADLSKCRFVLAAGVKFYGDYEVRNNAVFLNESVFQKPDRMTLAVIEGYAAVAGNKWLARRLLDATKATA